MRNHIAVCDAPPVVIRQVVATLTSIAPIERIWTRGVVHAGGPHYRLAGTSGPVSIGEDECLVLGRLIAHFRPEHCFIIGNGFGLSSAFIARMMESHGGVSVITLDNLQEGDGHRCHQIGEELRRRMDCRILCCKQGESPRDIGRSTEHASYDLVFIDGSHSHPQVVNDFRGVQHLLLNRSIVCWHDFWLPGVAESVVEAQHAGFRCVKINSSCEMVFGTKDDAVFRELMLLFPDGDTPTPRSHPLARVILTRSYIWSTVKARVTGMTRRQWRSGRPGRSS